MSQMSKRIERNLNELPAIGDTDGTKGDLPAVYIFTPDAQATWVVWEYDADTKEGFGMADLGMGFPELGYVSIDELLQLRGPFGLEVETDTRLNTRFKGYRNANIDIPDYLEA